MHNEYKSPLVRIGPKVVSVSDPAHISTIYGLNSGFTKTAFYQMFMMPFQGKFTASLFTSHDEGYHARIKRPIANAYAMSTMVEFEPLVNSTTALFLDRLDEFVDQRRKLDLGVWVQMYAFDVV